VIFMVVNFHHFAKKYFEKRIYYHKFLLFFILFFKKLTTIAYKMKGYLKLSTFIFWILPNLAKYTYRSLPLEQHQKEKICCNPSCVHNWVCIWHVLVLITCLLALPTKAKKDIVFRFIIIEYSSLRDFGP